MVINKWEFCEPKKADNASTVPPAEYGGMEEIEDEGGELPF
jgi:hypothetical protein